MSKNKKVKYIIELDVTELQLLLSSIAACAQCLKDEGATKEFKIIDNIGLTIYDQIPDDQYDQLQLEDESKESEEEIDEEYAKLKEDMMSDVSTDKKRILQ